MIAFRKTTYWLGLLVLLIQAPAQAQTPASFYHYQSATATPAKGWLVLLPGSSGLTIFNDTSHYYQAAYRFNNEGYHVLLVDYKKAYKAANRQVKESTGEKILWVLEEAIQWGKDNGYLVGTGGVIGWSLAGEGLVLLGNDAAKAKALGIEYMAMYYPSNKQQVQLNTAMPVLIQTGGADNVVAAAPVRQYLGGGNNTTLIVYKEAAHGFDVKSLEKPKKMRFPPLVGKKYVFQYHPTTAATAMKKLIQFIQHNTL